MTHADSSGPEGHAAAAHLGHAEPGGPPYFSAAEWESLHANDRAAGRTIILLMAGIFTIGLLLYAGIAFWIRASV